MQVSEYTAIRELAVGRYLLALEMRGEGAGFP